MNEYTSVMPTLNNSEGAVILTSENQKRQQIKGKALPNYGIR